MKLSNEIQPEIISASSRDVASRPSGYPNQYIFERDRFRCRYCGAGSDRFEAWMIASLTVDHVRPQCDGGSDEDRNLVTACRACNSYKGSAKVETFDEAKALVMERRERARLWWGRHVQPILRL